MPTPRDKNATRARIAVIAERQQGQIATRQLRALGVSSSTIGRWVREGYLHPGPRGSYSVGYPHRSRQSRWMAAVLAVPRSRLSFRSAGHNMRLLSWSLRVTEVTTTGGARGREDVWVHRARHLEGCLHNGIPSTAPALTILDLCTVLARRDRERVLDNAVAKLGMTVDELRVIEDRHPTHLGRRRLRETLDAHQPGSTLTRSRREEAFLRFLRTHGLPEPTAFNYVMQLPMGEIAIDAFYAEHALAIEIDDPSHDTPIQRARDRQRDQELALLGVHTIRLREDDLTPATARMLARLLATRRK